MSGPKNRMVVDGVDLYDEFGLVFGDNYELTLPEPIYDFLDVPGRDEPIDLTEFSGDVRYSQRKDKFVFFRLDGMSQASFEKAKTRLATFLHGKKHTYTLVIDEGYTYTGRLAITSDSKFSIAAGHFTVEATADAYKLKDTYTYHINAAGGVTITIPAGRRKVRPKIEVGHKTLITKDGQTWTLEPGTSQIRDLYFSGPENVVLINSFPEYSVAYWSDAPDETWYEGRNETWAQEAAGGEPIQEYPTWALDPDEIWATDLDSRWIDELYPATPGSEYNVYFQYAWEDL